MNAKGHNENAVRLASLAGDAQVALDKVARGEADATDGWLAYGAALNEGRALHAGDTEFGKWVAENSLCQVGTAEVDRHERAAAMWAAANADQLAEGRAASKARTVRGWHDQWKKVDAEREAEVRKAEHEAARQKAAAEAKIKRQEADAAAKAEAEARAEADAAVDQAEIEAAQARAADAARVKVEAETVAAEAEQIALPPVDTHAAERKKLASLTREGLEDEVIGLRADLADEKIKRKAIKAENDALKAKLRDHTGDKDEVIRRLQAAVKVAESAKWRATEDHARVMKQVYGLKKRVQELEQMGVAL